MADLFAFKPAEPWQWPITKAHLRGAIWLMALAVFVLLPKPMDGGAPPPTTSVVLAKTGTDLAMRAGGWLDRSPAELPR